MPPADPPSDAELVAAANAGDATAFEVLYRRHRDWVVRLAYRFTGNRDDALDVTQETFLYLLRRFPGFELSAKLTTFLYPVVKNIALARRRRRRPDVLADDALAFFPAPTLANDDPTGSELAAVLARLPEAQREVLLMRFVDGLRIADIAAALQIPPGTVKSRLHGALRALREDERTRRYYER